MNKRIENEALMPKKNFWAAIFIPMLLVALVAAILGQTSDILQAQFGIWYLILLALILYVLITLPALVVLLFIERNRLAVAHNQLLEAKVAAALTQMHSQQFVEFMPVDLCKRLGVAPLVLYRLFFPQAMAGDLSVNQSLLSFIHHGFAELAQAAKVVTQLSDSEDEDELVVKNNRLSFVIEHSVGLMYFIAAQTHGHPPDCKDTYFVKDALADYFDLTKAIVDFALQQAPSYQMSAIYEVFEDKTHQGWFVRNTDLLTHQCQLCAEQNPFAQRYQTWC